jgi:tetratricopeptide (TPR) repeat protein
MRDAQELTALAYTERKQGHLDLARQHYEEAAALYRAEGADLRLAHTVRHVGDIFMQQRLHDAAGPCYAEALALYRQHPEANRLDLANALRATALYKEASGHLDESKALWREAGELYAQVGIAEGVAESQRRQAS